MDPEFGGRPFHPVETAEPTQTDDSVACAHLHLSGRAHAVAGRPVGFRYREAFNSLSLQMTAITTCPAGEMGDKRVRGHG